MQRLKFINARDREITFADHAPFVFWKIQGLEFPVVEPVYTQSSGQHGYSLHGVLLESRKVLLTCHVHGKNGERHMYEQRRELNRVCNPLLGVRVAANALTIAPADITDERFDTELCGLINSIRGLDPSVWQAQFEAFMAAVRVDADTELIKLTDELMGMLSAFQAEWDTWFEVFNRWKSLTISELAMQLSFAFDNQFAFPGTVMEVDYSERDTIIETLRWTATGDTFCKQTTVFNVDGGVTTRQTVHYPDGEVLRDVIATTVLTGEKPRTEVVAVG